MGDPVWRRVAKRDDVSGEGPYAAAADDVDLVLVRTASGLKAYEGRCPHRGALLGEGELQGTTLVCRNHRWRFDAASGKRDGGPECLTPCPVREAEGDVLVEVSALLAKRATTVAPRRTIADLPGPRGLPVVGSMFQVDPKRFHLQAEEWGRTYGTPYRVTMGPKTFVIYSSLDSALTLFGDRPETFRRTNNVERVFDELGVGGVFSAEGTAWRPQRKLAMEALSHRHLRGFYPTLAGVAERFRARWMKASAAGTVLDLAEELKRFTVDVTTQLVLGHDLDTLSSDGGVIQDKLGLFFPTFNRRLFATIPWWRLVRMPADRAVDRAVGELREWVSGLVRDARARLAADPARAARPANFLEASLLARDEHGEPFDDATIFGNLMNMLLAGEDTTAYTLAWSVHHLLDAPGEVTALRAEVDRVLGGEHVPPDLETNNKLAYAGAIANETMRLRPVAPLLFFEPIVDTVVEGVELPKGTFIMFLVREPAVAAENFGAPNDFRPARWVDASATDGAHEPGAHQPFGSGPRICPGRTLALVEMKLALATMYRSFDIERVGSAADVREAFAFTMYPENLAVRVRTRS